MPKVIIVRDHASMKVGDELTVSDRWAAWAKVQGIAEDAPVKKKTSQTKTTAKPEPQSDKED